MRVTRTLALAPLMALGAVACDNVLEAENLSSPDVERVFATPAAIEQTIGTGYQACHNTMASNNLMPQLLTLSLESYSQLNNFNMGVRAAIPRTPVQNYTGAPSIFADFSGFARAGRLAANAINALDKLKAEDATPNDGVMGSVAQDIRARAFGFFVVGCHQGWMAMVYDSAGAVRHGMPSDSIPPLSGAAEVMAAAIEMLDSAEAQALLPQATGTGGFPLPAAWIGGTPATAHASRDNFVRIIRSYRARFRAGVARTPAQRDAVDWTRVLNDATNGITADWLVQVGGQSGWNIGFIGSQMFQDGRGWSQVSLMYHGMADTSGAYDAWIALARASRAPFLVRTPDRRWPAGATRAAQVTASGTPSDFGHKPYILADDEDETGEPFGNSWYQGQRTYHIRLSTNQGKWGEMVKAEIDMLAAEAHLRLGNFAAAAALIDAYRVPNNLPPVAGITNLTTPVPGATYATDGTLATTVPGAQNCVPRIPTPAGNDTQCGNIFEAMKYEKRMETGYTSYGRWFFDSRGWGDLPEGSPLEYPVPYQELNARAKPTYSLGGGLASSAARGTYGF